MLGAEKCLGYRFSSKYSKQPLRIVSIEGHDKGKVNRNEMSERKQRLYGHLGKWFNFKLEIDAKGAREFLVAWYEGRKDNEASWEWKRSRGRRFGQVLEKKDPFASFKYLNIAIDAFEAKDFYWNVDDTTRRLHSSLTNLKKELRNFVTYDKQSLFCIDLKNSQPYLSLLLFKKEFWTNEHYINSEDIRQYRIVQEICKIHYKKEYMIDKLPKIADTEPFKEYRNLVSRGELYDDLLNYTDDSNSFHGNRKQLKEEFVQWLFAGNQFSNPLKRLFRERFPEAYELFNFIKKGRKNRLAYLLQSIESTIFLQIITKRLNRKAPYLPIFTLHDGIVTTEAGIGLVQQIMTEELTNCLGAKPALSIEKWSPEELFS